MLREIFSEQKVGSGTYSIMKGKKELVLKGNLIIEKL